MSDKQAKPNQPAAHICPDCESGLPDFTRRDFLRTASTVAAVGIGTAAASLPVWAIASR